MVDPLAGGRRKLGEEDNVRDLKDTDDTALVSDWMDKLEKLSKCSAGCGWGWDCLSVHQKTKVLAVRPV